MWTHAFDWSARGYDANNAYWLARLARMAYRERPGIERETCLHWGRPEVRFYADVEMDSQACLLIYDAGLLLAFRGTESLTDWRTNLTITQESIGVAQVHRGFWRAAQSLREKRPKLYSAREEYLAARQPAARTLGEELAAATAAGRPVFLCGHSLGGAMAVVAAHGWRQAGGPLHGGVLPAVYTFGQPRAGADSFATALRAPTAPGVYQHVNDRDIVPRVPPRKLGYEHIALSHVYDGDGRLLEGDAADKKRAEINDFSSVLNPFRAPEGVADHDMGNYVGLIEEGRWPVVA